MPRKTKDEEVKKVTKKRVKKADNVEVEAKSTSIKKVSKPSASKAKSKATTSKVADKTVTSKKGTSTKVAEKKSTSSKAKSSTSKKATSKTTTKKSMATKKTTTKKNTTTKKTATKKETTSSKKTTTRKSTTKKSSSKKAKPITTMEYYDLPAAYNRTIIKILAQTPSSLFVYWEISEDDRLRLQNEYGDQFFQNTRPHLVITNETMNYSFEVEINDYANSWYIHINDSDCKYAVKLIRKSVNHTIIIPNSFVDIISSNEISAPNDHILFDRLGKTVFFRNVKNNHTIEKDISSLSFISNIGRVYNIYDLYKEIYKNELNGDELGVNLSSSGSSSTFK